MRDHDPNPNVVHLRPLDKLIVYAEGDIQDAAGLRETLSEELGWPLEDVLVLQGMRLGVVRTSRA